MQLRMDGGNMSEFHRRLNCNTNKATETAINSTDLRVVLHRGIKKHDSIFHGDSLLDDLLAETFQALLTV